MVPKALHRQGPNGVAEVDCQHETNYVAKTSRQEHAIRRPEDQGWAHGTLDVTRHEGHSGRPLPASFVATEFI